MFERRSMSCLLAHDSSSNDREVSFPERTQSFRYKVFTKGQVRPPQIIKNNKKKWPKKPFSEYIYIKKNVCVCVWTVMWDYLFEIYRKFIKDPSESMRLK